MAGRRARSGTGLARPGPASGTRGPWSSTTRPDPAGPDILERSPGRWFPSRLPGPPRWLLAAIAVLVLAGAGIALASGAGRPGRASPDSPRAQPAVQQAGDPAAAAAAMCSAIAGSFGRPGLANRFRERPQDAGCARPGTGQARAGGPGTGSSSICVALQDWATQFGVRHRCYPGLS